MNKSNDILTTEKELELEKLQYKIILLGDGTVGKSSIAQKFSNDKFDKNYKQTVGCDFFIRRLDIPPKYQVSLQIWDIGGQSIGSKMISKYVSGAHAVLLCYDVTNFESFANLEDWHNIVIKTFRGSSLPFTALIGNKNDLRYMSTVNIDLHNQFADENGMTSFLMSAKNGDQVKQAFWKIAVQLSGAPNIKYKEENVVSVIPATIIEHPRHDEDIAGGKVPDYTKQSKCIIS
jgi:Ras-related protein Rab-28